MDKMLFSLDYDCYYYPRFLDRKVCANSVDPDQMSHYALCVQGLHHFTLTQQCLDKSVGSIMALSNNALSASVVKSRIESSGIPGLFLKQLPLG